MNRHQNTVDRGYCRLHGRKRTKVDLIPWEERPGSFRCKPHKECRIDEKRICSIHNRTRQLRHLNEVSKGRWECKAQYPCYGTSAAQAIRTARIGEGRQNRQRDATANTNSNEWIATGEGGNARMRQQQRALGLAADGGADARQFAPVQRDYQATRRVRCAYHGKLLNINQCNEVDDCCFICKDQNICLSTPLETTSLLRNSGCSELLCYKHQTLRSVRFLDLDGGKQFYVCTKKHPCQHKTLSRPAKTEAVFSEYNGAPEDEGYEEGGEGAGIMEGFAQTSGREAVSSFFT